MTFLSLVVPIFGVESYLRKCLDSIIGQSYQDFEVILVDDGSRDGAPAICDEYAARDSRIRVIHKINEGLVRARKTGVAASTGQYVGFVDGDDWIEPDMYQVLCAAAESELADIVACDFWLEYEDGPVRYRSVIPEGTYAGTALVGEVYPRMITTRRFGEAGIVPAVWSKIYRREILVGVLENIPDGIRNGEDGACTYPAILESSVVVIVGDAYYHYRQHENQMTRSLDVEHWESVTIWAQVLRASAATRTCNRELLDQIDYYIQVKTTLLLYAVFADSEETIGHRWSLLRRVASSPTARQAAKQRSLGELPFESKLALRLIECRLWPVIPPAHLTVRGVKMLARFITRR